MKLGIFLGPILIFFLFFVDDFVAWTCKDIFVYGEEIVLLYRSNIILLSSLALVQLTIPDTENYRQRTDNYWHGR